MFRSDMTVELVDANCSDDMVVAAARVSTQGVASRDAEADEKFIDFLIRNRHMSPVEHGLMTFYVEAPIFVWREHMRHRMASYNEESARYKKLEPVFYVPGPDRPLVQEGKPGHYKFVTGTDEQYQITKHSIEVASVKAYSTYAGLMDYTNVAKEVARMVLPVNIYSSCYVSMNPRAMMNFLSLRTKNEDSAYPSFPMREIEMVAERYEEEWAKLMPLTHKAFDKHGRVGL